MEKVVTTVLPTDAQLGALERTWIVDNVVGESPIGNGVMAVLAVGETENGQTYRTGSDGGKYRGGGEFAPLRVFSAADYYGKFGRLGFTTEEGPSRGAVARRSGGNTLWNGNLYVLINGWKYASLIVCRVDNSAGDVTFRRHAALRGGQGPFNIEPGDVTTFQRNGATDVTVTWNAAKAQVVGVGGTYPTLFTGGETAVVQIDDDAPKTIFMTSAEQLLVDVIAKIDADMGAVGVATDVGGELAINSVIRGKAGRVRILGGTAMATLGHVLSPVLDQWTFSVTNVTAGLYTLRVEIIVNGVLTSFDSVYTAGGGETTTQLRDAMLTNGTFTGFNDLDPPPTGVTFAASGAVDLTATGIANLNIVSATVVAEPGVGDITVANNQVGQYTDQSGSGDVNNIDDITATEYATHQSTGTNLISYVDSEGFVWTAETATPSSGTLQATAGVVADFGFDVTKIANAAAGLKITIPAGTRVYDSTTATSWVTLEDYETETTGGGFDLKVRPWEDTDTAVASAIAGIDTVTDMPYGYWSVTNAATLTRLSKTQLDLRYKDAFDRTLDANSDASLARIVMSARSSKNIDAFLLANSNAAASAGTLSPRRCIFSPPVGTSLSTALGNGDLGVGANRDDRRVYCFPGIRKLVPEIGVATSAAGVGFTDDGIVQTPATAMYAFIRAILPAERSVGENPGTNEIGALSQYGLAGLENAFDSTQGGQSLVSANYVAFKAAGITAINRITGIGYMFQSDVSSVDPNIDTARAPASRGFLFDEIGLQLWYISIPFKDKLARPFEIQALLSLVRGYLSALRSEDQPDRQRIYSYSVAVESSDDQLRNGFVLLKVEIQRFPHIKAIVYNVNLTPAAVSVVEAA